MKPKQLHSLAIAALFAVGFPAFAAAQQSPPRIGLLAYWPCEMQRYMDGSGEFGAFLHGLRELGYKAGQSVTVDCRSAGKQYDGLTVAALELTGIPVDVIVTMSQPAGHAARKATETIPIVTIVSGDPVGAGLAQSLARPGGNLTGVSYYATELSAKRLELLLEAVPGLKKIGMLANPKLSYLPFEEDARKEIRRLGLTALVEQVSAPHELDAAFSRMKAEGAEAVFILPDLMLADQSPHLAALAIKHRLPMIGWGDWFTEAGCLMAYSADYSGMGSRLAFYVDRILHGAKPGNLPIEQPTTFTLSVNLKTAKTLGIDLPQTLLLMAGEVVE
ncbi:ABC transporter substrate-binding protein [Sinorhizobium mexicanum]|uniref:ABC transporter substrate-binding protein n=1 Tax=Sinorhizobium mexicanum TaxID=375549 RepID=A0A859QKZ3_9HYPH|nr:ABC transporter substrate-binding protein [Sinorhizobium mexicanum]MBP1882535.1 putative ABC transport system substrate-binding protein [Sinorhizobium mexicanum]QLL62207.1 ABC transporter substrate-binding protein [Sinorhizobium mexicanum]